jgi:ABC-type oligopeptide transport system substrate-binding subunit
VKPENIVSNGPFTLAEFTPNAHVKAVKNPHFHDADNVQIDTIYLLSDRRPGRSPAPVPGRRAAHKQ